MPCKGFPPEQLTNDHEPACMCHLYRLRINTHVLTKDHVHSYRATWWQLGLSSKEDICVSLCQLLVWALAGAGPSQTPSIAIRRRGLHAGTSVLIRGGPLRISEKYSRGRWRKWHKDNTQVVSFHYKGIYRSCQWLLESLDLGSLCWLIFGGKSTECGKFKAG